MKRAIVLFAIGLLTACGSGKPAVPAKVHMEIMQLTGIASSQPEGPFDVQLGLQVENLTNQPITLKHVELSQVGQGAWVLRTSAAGIGANRPLNFSTVIAPGSSEGVSFWEHAYAFGARGEFRENEPVILRATVYFDSPGGGFHETGQQILEQRY
jgi:hypothetical protein